MSAPEFVLLVRFKSKLPLEEIEKVMDDRIEDFRALKGLQQKYYLEDPATGEVAGCYLWDNAEALTEYRNSELRASIGAAYQTEGEPRVEVYRVLRPLRD